MLVIFWYGQVGLISSDELMGFERHDAFCRGY